MSKVKLTYFDIDAGRAEATRIDHVSPDLNARLSAAGGEYFADGRFTVADLKVFVWVRSREVRCSGPHPD